MNRKCGSMAFDKRWDTLRVVDNVVVWSNISVTGPTNITGLATINSDLSVQGDVYLVSNLSVGHDIFANQCTLNSLIVSSISVHTVVSGTVTLQEDLTILDDLIVYDTLSIGGQTTLTGQTILRSTLSVGNNAVVSSVLSVTDLVVASTLSVGGNVVISSSLSVKDQVTLASTLNVSDLVTFASTTSTGGVVYMTSALSVGSHARIASTLSVGNHTHLNSTLSVSGNANIGGGVYQAGALLVPTGTILLYSVSSAPDGYLICNGATVSRSTYSSLFAVVGTTFGSGNGTTTFNLPNMEDRLPYGYKSGADIGTFGGSESVTLSTNNIPAHTHTGTTDSNASHTHTVTDTGHPHQYYMGKDDGNSSNSDGQVPAGDSNTANYGVSTSTATTGISIVANGAHTHAFTTGSTGSGTSFSVLNPYMRLAYIIKY